MGRALSRDLRDRVVAAVESGVSCRRAAERFGVSAASAIRWRQLVLAHGTSVAKPQGGDRRTLKIEDHAAFILAARAAARSDTGGVAGDAVGAWCKHQHRHGVALLRPARDHAQKRPAMQRSRIVPTS